ncbi:MAG TPA: membrane-bound lytic murein transglycosylase MltF [Gammaproteobacteria bacterium]|nr:membrane-bound lytic murein transglycosylase MltF [Gammaproteobacteria bacterium]
MALRVSQAVLVAAAFCLLATFAHSPSLLSRIQNAGVLVLATPNSPTTYYLAAYGPSGPDYDLGRRLAKELGVRLEVLQVANGDQALRAVAAGRADIAAPGVAVRPADFPYLSFAPPYQMVSQVLVYRTGETVPRSLATLGSSGLRITVAPGYQPLLRQLARTHPGLEWQVKPRSGADELLVDVAEGRARYTVVSENEFRLNRQFYPQLQAAFPLTDEQPLAWAVGGGADTSLYQATVAFFARAQADQQVTSILGRYYGNRDTYDPLRAEGFLNDLGSRFADYASSFERAASAADMPWQLLAAVGYQESHWNPRARSPTGVRGMMMLTEDTAQKLGVSDRSDAHLSIRGGARYIGMLRARLPASIPEPDRTWMALAAYNIGYAHILDALALTKKMGWDPDRWADVKRALPLLAERRYYRDIHYGYANGEQAVRYVTNIRSYYEILAWRSAQNSLPRQVSDSLAAAVTRPAL